MAKIAEGNDMARRERSPMGPMGPMGRVGPIRLVGLLRRSIGLRASKLKLTVQKNTIPEEFDRNPQKTSQFVSGCRGRLLISLLGEVNKPRRLARWLVALPAAYSLHN
jgi:hypothetical protein